MVTRRLMLGGALAAAGAPMAWAQDRTFDSQALHAGRATVEVFLNDQGPFHFIVDTAANASVIAADLVERLQLPPLGNVGMHTLVGRETVPTVRGRRLKTGALDTRDIRLAVGRRAAMGGLDGLLGCDLLIDSRVILNFRGRGRVRIAHSSGSPRSFNGHAGSVPEMFAIGERRFGNIMMIDARIGTRSGGAIIDSGAESTAINRAAALAGRAVPISLPDGQTSRRIQSPTGEAITGELMLLREFDIAGMTITNLPVVVGDFHTFRIWQIDDRPAMLIGLDVLRLFSTVHIDLKRSEFVLRT